MKPLEKIFLEELGEMLHIEELLLKALPKMRDAAESPGVKRLLDQYRAECQAQSQRVRELFDLFEQPARERKCDAMLGVLLKGQQLMQRSAPSPALSAALLCLSRKINSYKVVSYETLAVWSKGLGQKEAAKMLEKSLRAERAAATRLEPLAGDCNGEAARQVDEPSRKATPAPARKPAEVLNGTRWGSW